MSPSNRYTHLDFSFEVRKRRPFHCFRYKGVVGCGSTNAYGSNFSGWIFCQMNVTFSSTLSINYTQFYYGIIKTKIFSDISFQIRVIIYLQNNSKLAICLSICLSIFCILGLIRITLWAPEYKKID